MANRELDGIHVLVVEDNDDSREMLRVGLEQCGALVMVAATVEEAARTLRTFHPHILVTDIGMPGNGLALIQKVRALAEEDGFQLPNIAVTAYWGRRAELLAAGFVEVVEKPVNPVAFCAAVHRHTRAA